MHLAMSDPTGDSAIVGYVDGEQTIHHGRQFPGDDELAGLLKQLAITEYWEQIGGVVMLPGTNQTADRFARLVLCQRDTEDRRCLAVGGRSVQRHAQCVGAVRHFGPDEPNISSTRWRTVVDHKALRYFFESARCRPTPFGST